MMEHRILQGDVMDGLRALPDNCVQCTVTSPPYFALRDYGVDGQIGLEATPEEFIDTMVRVFREVRRVTRPDGVLFLNLGDSYAGSGCGANDHREDGASISKNNQKYNGQHTGISAGYKAKDLMGIPWRVAFALQADGWYFRSAMPWIKRNCMPESTTDRPTSAIEYIFLMAKSAKYFYDGEAIRVPSSESYQNDARPQGVLRQKVNKRSKYPDAGQFKKQDQTGNPTYTGFNERWKERKSVNDFRPHSSPNSKELKRAQGIPDPEYTTRNYRNSDPFFESWQGLYSESENPLAFVINPQSRPELHFATFPDLLAATCIKAGTSEYGCCPKCGAPYQRIVECSGGTTGKGWHPHADDGVTGQIGGMPTEGYARQFKGWKPGCKCGEKERSPCLVLDPFMGSGTVAVVARELNRSSVGCELNPAYVEIIKKRLNAGSQLDTGVVSYRFEKVPGTAGTNSKVR
jgi:DNA modification methylase